MGVRYRIWATVTVPAIALIGCFGPPIAVTVQPELVLHVSDQAQRPIEGANVYYLVFADPEARFRGQRSTQTDEQGLAKFDSVTKWEGMLHQVLYGPYSQAWCVEAAVYEVSYGLTPTSDSPVRVELSPRVTNLACRDLVGRNLSEIRDQSVVGGSRWVEDGRLPPDE